MELRGLNQNHNHDLKSIFKGAATKASSAAGPFHDFYTALLAKGMKPTMARLRLARKIVAITLTVWKKGVVFDAQLLKPSVSFERLGDKSLTAAGIMPGDVPWDS